jgi:hypothetical protein
VERRVPIVVMGMGGVGGGVNGVGIGGRAVYRAKDGNGSKPELRNNVR